MRRLAHPFFAATVLLITSVCVGQTVALRGTIVSPTGVIEDGIITLNGSTIVSVRKVSGNVPAEVINVGGVIFPGLVDLHNHITWNVFPRWTPPRLSANRYEWQEMPEYKAALSQPHAELVSGGYNCDLNRYGELKEIVNGATATVGSIPDECIRGLARNLDFLSELSPGMKIGDDLFRNEIFPLEIRTSCGEQAMRDVGRTLEDCAANVEQNKPVPPRAFVAHLAEGVDASSRREFAMFTSHGYLHPGGNIIHGVSLGRTQFDQMASAGVGLIWSPRSNVELYGKTTDITSAKAAGVLVAIAPDWSPSGSTGMLGELAYIDRMSKTIPDFRFTSHELFEMTTVIPARLARLEDRIGKLATGYAADLIVMRRPEAGKNASAYDALVHQDPADLLLVIVGGIPVFGESRLMMSLLPGQQNRLEDITICGQSRRLNVQVGSYQNVPWKDTETKLRTALSVYGIQPAPLVECNP